ncbi:MAG: hypothetical protein JOY80_13010 [Candidatus Dormibacteraeota bacterium]|nr:hypothetical protein [Candidatus Dormibacteraeota bacterium]
MRRPALAGIAAATVAAAVFAFGAPAHVHAAANTITVTGTGDATVSACTGTSPSLTCATLRDAVSQANSDSGDTINLPAGTITLDQCSSMKSIGLDIEKSMTVNGQGSGSTTVTGGTCSGGSTAWNDALFFNCNTPLTLAFNGVTLANGNASDAGESGATDGGALDLGEDPGACDPPDNINLSLNDVDFNNDVTSCSTCSVTQGVGAGGGLYFNSTGPISMNHVTFSHNSAALAGGGAYIDTNAAITLKNVYAHDNTACALLCTKPLSDEGGGALALVSTPQSSGDAATNLLISNNTVSSGEGGGVIADLAASSMTWNNMTLNGNKVTSALNPTLGVGGGFYMTSVGQSDITNVTATGNVAQNAGGAFHAGIASTMHLTFATINGNSVTTSAGTGGGIFQGHSSHVTLSASFLYQDNVGSSLSECDGALTSAGYNRADDTTCGLTQSTDQQSSSFNPQLSAPAANPVTGIGPSTVGATSDSSPLLTEAPATGSPVIDQLPDPAPCIPGSTFDARGVPRPQGPACDLGAFEAIPPVPPTGAGGMLPPEVVGVAAGGLTLVLGALLGMQRRRRTSSR